MTNFFKHKMRGKSPGEIIGWILFGIIAITGLAILLGYVIMRLWNWLMPDIFGLTTINYWQAVGLFIMLKLLLGGCGGSSSSNNHNSSKHSKSSCKKESKNEFSKWKHYDKFWEEEGNKAYEEYVERMNEQNNDKISE